MPIPIRAANRLAFAAAALFLSLSSVSHAAMPPPAPGVHPGGYESPDMPEIWRNTDELTIRRAEEVALMDAWGKLAEFATGMEILSDTKVRDLTELDQKLAGTLHSTLSRLSHQELTHYENGLVQCNVTVDIADLRRFLAGEPLRDVADVSDAEWLSGGYAPEPAPEYLEVWGNGALAGSAGVSMAHAVRAAEVDASTQLAAMLEGVQLDRQTRVRDFVLASDVVKSVVAATLMGVRYTGCRIGETTVEVDAEVSFVAVIQNIITLYESDKDLCAVCEDGAFAQFEEALTREEKTTHRVTGKAVLRRALETRRPNARKAIDEARHARKLRNK